MPDNYFVRLGRATDPDAVFLAYQEGDAEGVIVGLLPLVANTIWKLYPTLSYDIRNDVVSAVSLSLTSYVREVLMDKTFDAAPKIIAYMHRYIRTVAGKKLVRVLPQVIEACGDTNPLIALIATPDAEFETEDSQRFVRSFVRSKIRLSGIHRRHALVVISEGRTALRGVTTPDTARFIFDYLSVMARIAGRQYDGA